MKKRILSMLLAMLMVMTLVPTALADDILSGTWQDNEYGHITYRVDSNNVLHIEGSGEWSQMSVGSVSGQYNMHTQVTAIEISSEISYIPDKFLRNFYNAQSINDSGYYYRSVNGILYDLTIGPLFTTQKLAAFPTGRGGTFNSGETWCIGSCAFSYNKNISKVELPKVNTIEAMAFSKCTGLESVTLSKNLESISPSAFGGCTSLKDVYYDGTETQWKNISGIEGCFDGATIHFGKEEHNHSYSSVKTAPTCTEQGYTTYTCSCGNSYKADYVAALGHSYKNGKCTVCSAISPNITQQDVYNAIIAMKEKYPEGTPWNGDYTKYVWNTTPEEDVTFIGYDCTAFAYMMSDEAFGDSPVYYVRDSKELRIGDIVHFAEYDDKPAHDAVIIGISSDGYTLAEGNYNKTVHWGRTITRSWMEQHFGYGYSRYPELADGQFTDVPSDAFYANAVKWAVENEITTGVGNNRFDPNGQCTRGQVVTFLWRAAGKPIVSTNVSFSDVQPGAFYYEAVKWAVANGITTGVGGNRFAPNDSCTRGQVVTFLHRAENSPSASTVSSFTDVPSTAFYYNAVNWAVENGITSGVGNNRFAPNDTCTRGQVVTFLYRAQ